jgi:hypothetical protein
MARPFFAAEWAESQKIYDPVNSGERVARVVGDMLKKISTIQNLTKDGATPVQCA